DSIQSTGAAITKFIKPKLKGTVASVKLLLVWKGLPSILNSLRAMHKKTSVTLAIAATVLSVNSLPALAEKLGAPIPGYTFRDGVYQPNEPYREGQPRVTGLQQPFPRMKAVEENPVTPAKFKLGR